MELKIPSPLEEIRDSFFEKKGIQILIKRDDLIHPHVSGNKWRKLKYPIQDAIDNKSIGIISFGGAYSNHLRALAAAARMFDLKSIAFIRGEEPKELNANLRFCIDSGMELNYISREEYREKDKKEFINKLKSKYPNYYLIPEGGSCRLGVKGCEEIVLEIEEDFDFVCASVGTGTTASGIINSLNDEQSFLGFSALKGGAFISQEIAKYLNGPPANYELILNYHFGGYAKVKSELIEFVRVFQKQHSILLDYVYTGKMLFGIYDLIEQDYFPRGSRIVVLHSGGVLNASVD